MAKTENRRINLYINGKEVENSVKGIRAEYKKSNNQLNKMIIGSKEYNKKAAEVKGLKKHLQDHNKTLGYTSASWSGLKALLPTVSFAAVITGAIAAGKEIFNLTIQTEQLEKRFNIVFGDSANIVEEGAVRMADKMGLTVLQFKEAATAAGDLLIPLGFTREESAKMSTELIGLSGALNDWTGGHLGAKQVSEILTKALLGENEQLKQLGIAVSMESEEFRKLVKQKKEDIGATTEQAKALATLEMIKNKSADAQTAYLAEESKYLRIKKDVVKWWQKQKEAVVEYYLTKPSEKMEREKNAVNNLTIELNDANLSEERRKDILSKLQRIAPQVIENIDAENISYEKLTENLTKYNEQMENKIVLQKEDELIASQEKKKNEALELVGKSKRRLIDTMREEVQWFEKYQEEANAILNDESKRTIEKAEALNSLAFKESSFGNADLGNALNSYKIYKTQFYNYNEELGRSIKEKKELEKELLSGSEQKKVETHEVKTIESNLTLYDDDAEWEAEMDADMAKYLAEWDKYQKEVQALKTQLKDSGIANMKDGIAKERAMEEARWAEEKENLEAKLINKDFANAEELEKNEILYGILEEKKKAHFDRLAELDEAEKNRKIAEDIAAQELKVLEAETDEEEFQARLELLQSRYDQEMALAGDNQLKQLQAKKNYQKEVNKLEQDALQQKIARLEQEREIRDAKIAVANTALEAVKTALGEETAIGKLAYLAQQAFAIGQVWFNTQIANAKATAASPLTFGQPWVGINTAQAIASTALIAAQTLTGFESGGYTDRDGSNKKVAGVVHSNEWVSNARTTNDSVTAPIIRDLDDYQRGIRTPEWIENFSSSPNFEEALPAVGFQVGGYGDSSNTVTNNYTTNNQGSGSSDKFDVIIAQNEQLLLYLSDPNNRKAYIIWDELQKANNEMANLYKMGRID
ncbi:hypothetical protein [Marinifilum breve]|nr:hypothetical protein [Marinifilum breve]